MASVHHRQCIGGIEPYVCRHGKPLAHTVAEVYHKVVAIPAVAAEVVEFECEAAHIGACQEVGH